MCKCDWCPDSKRDKKGNIICPFKTCWMSQDDTMKIIEKILNNNKVK